MQAGTKIVMQVTITADECPELHRELIGVTAARRRVKRFLGLAGVGLLVEQGRLGATLSASSGRAAASTSMSLKPLALEGAVSVEEMHVALVGQSIAEMTDAFGDVDEKD